MIFASVFIIQGLEMRKLCLLIALMVSLFTHISTLADGVETCGVENMPAAIKIRIPVFQVLWISIARLVRFVRARDY